MIKLDTVDIVCASTAAIACNVLIAVSRVAAKSGHYEHWLRILGQRIHLAARAATGRYTGAKSFA